MTLFPSMSSRRNPRCSSHATFTETTMPPRVATTGCAIDATMARMSSSSKTRCGITPQHKEKPSGASIHRDDARAAETKIVLEGDLGVRDLPLVRLTTKLPHELG